MIPITARPVLSLFIAFIVALLLPTPAHGAATPDVPFLGDIYELQAPTQQVLATAHKRVPDKDVVQSLDDDYNDLRASVNGLLERIASDVENNSMHQDVWQQRATTVIQEARDFYNHAKNAGRGRRQSGSRPVDIKCPTGIHGCSFEVNYDFEKMIQDGHTLRIDQLKVDDAQRQAYAARVRAHFWPRLCEIGLEKPACPAPSKT